ncbi:hypothetical protein [Massilia sp. 9096]|uniref:NMCC_0638 family (lipo)protein n=1 Tax=Massilia sp. 9096 TaxID=1500894 RepID=UPI00056684D8|nr:hypothetical protein [Massilia sp. 9096]
MTAPVSRVLLAAWLVCAIAVGQAQAASAQQHDARHDAKRADKHAARASGKAQHKPAGKPANKAANKREPKPVEATPSTVDPDGEGFLKLYTDLCVKRIDALGAFRRKLLRTKVPKLQPERAKLYLAGLDGDAWPVSYNGKTGNFVLVLAEDNDQCMLYARRTDRVAVEQGFTDLVAKAHLAARTTARTNGDALTLSATVRPRGEHAMRFALTTQSAPDAKLRAVGLVELNPLADPAPPPPPKKARKPSRRSSGSPAPAHRPRARP